MDDRAVSDEPTVLDLPATLVRLGEVEALVWRLARDGSRGVDAQLQALTILHRLLLDRVQVIEFRDIQMAQRMLERSLAMRAELE